MSEPNRTIAFVCVQNAGRSQMAYAFAERAVSERGLDEQIDLIMGGTNPASAVHPEVITAMAEVGFDISDQTPRAVTVEEVTASDYVITMGCSGADVCPANWDGENLDWDLPDPAGKSPAAVAEIRDEITSRVNDLLDEIVGTA